jgi:uncharacterized protein
LDVYNLECDYYNFGADPLRFIDALDLDAVREIHVAGGPVYQGYKVDIHSRIIAGSTLALLGHVLDLASRVEVVVFEVLKEAIPSMGIDVLMPARETLVQRQRALLAAVKGREEDTGRLTRLS